MFPAPNKRERKMQVGEAVAIMEAALEMEVLEVLANEELEEPKGLFAEWDFAENDYDLWEPDDEWREEYYA